MAELEVRVNILETSAQDVEMGDTAEVDEALEVLESTQQDNAAEDGDDAAASKLTFIE